MAPDGRGVGHATFRRRRASESGMPERLVLFSRAAGKVGRQTRKDAARSCEVPRRLMIKSAPSAATAGDRRGNSDKRGKGGSSNACSVVLGSRGIGGICVF